MSAERFILHPRQLIQPYFAVTGRNRREEIPHMPGIFRLSPDLIVKDAEELLRTGVKGLLLFGIARRKDASGSDAFSQEGAIQSAVRALRREFGKTILITTDVCLCGFTDHGHCGLLKDRAIDRKKTLETLGRVAVTHAQAGADFVAPSAMTQGQVRAVRNALDHAGFKKTKIWAYAIKYASAFYGPFRDALDSEPKFGDRRAYQMDPAGTNKALASALQDQKYGADILMVKPALPYLDIIFRLSQKTKMPVAAYHVSGEYAMLKGAARNGSLDEKKAVLEVLGGIRRAGADMIVTYYAKQVARWFL